MRLESRDLACVRGGRTVFEGLSFDLDAGTALALEGPNGAGKTSLLRLIAGLLRPAGGSILLRGANPDLPVGEHCHYLGHANGVKRALSVAENARFWIEYLGGVESTDAVLDRVGLDTLASIPAALLSAGQARRLGLARLLAAHRPVWLLDEPSVSLDEAGRDMLGALIEEHLEAGGLVIAATHLDLGQAFSRRLSLQQERTP